jgi:hypothetical protein
LYGKELQMGDKALLIGINTYPGAPLRGCVNDVSDMAEMLVGRYGFKNKQVRLLCDGRATTKEIWSRLGWLTDVKSGDRCFLHFSGHGVQVVSRNRHNHEPDGLDEAICPVDFSWHHSRMITDNQFYDLFRRMRPGVRFSWVSDCCHSGTMTREMPLPEGVERTSPVMESRAYPVPIDVMWRQRSIGEQGLRNEGKALVRGQLDVGFVSGCRDNQTSSDTFVNGRPCGALTHYLMKHLKSMPKNTPLSKVVKSTAKDLKRAGYTQVPQVSGGRKGKPFLG